MVFNTVFFSVQMRRYYRCQIINNLSEIEMLNFLRFNDELK